MITKAIKRTLIFSFVFIGLLLIIQKDDTQAANETDQNVTMLPNGDFWFETTDTTATSNITWRTIGFTVRRDECEDGNPLKDGEYTYFWLKDGQKDETPHPNGKTTVVFKLTKKQVNTALEKKRFQEIQEDDLLYLNGIFKVSNGKTEGPFYTLHDIKNAENWNNKEDFKDRFNIQVKYKPGPDTYPVTITYQLYQSGNKKEIERTEKAQLKTHGRFVTNYENIPISKEEKGEKYYLYRVYYQDLPKKTVLGNRKTETNPYLDWDSYLDEIKKYVRDREFYMQAAAPGESLNIVALYRRFPLKEEDENKSEVTKDYEEIDPTGVIGADNRGNEAYDVSNGIPGTEAVYANVFTSKYLAGSKFIRKYGKKIYNVKVSVTYNLSWEEKDPKTGKLVPRTKDVPMNYTYQVEREYSYWTIESLGIYALDKAVVRNAALDRGSVTLIPLGYSPLAVSYTHSEKEADHLLEPVTKGETVAVSLSPISISDNTVPDNSFKTEAEANVNQIKCKNDKLIFNGETIMSPAIQEKKTEIPKEIPSGLLEVGENVLYKSGIMIPASKANGEYESSGIVYYKAVAELKPASVGTEIPLSEINPVTVHTPVVCDGMVQDNRSDNQMIAPDIGRASLVLDRPFYVTLPTTGNHRYIQGYGYRDYGKYTGGREVKFTFDTYKGSSAAGLFIPQNTWTSVTENNLFYLPTWVPEGKYEIRYRSTAINAAANDGCGKTEYLANTELSNYAAEDNSMVQISGRIYGLNIYDVTDYPMWEKVFRLPNSLKRTDFCYTVGTKNQNGESNGQNPKYTITMVNGSHPIYKNQGILKTGYITRFSLTTVGSMADSDDYVRINPKFYFVDKNGKNRREADIYYTESFNGKEHILVKMGGNLDLENAKTLKTGDPYLGIPESELKRTAYYEGVSLTKWKSQAQKIYHFMNIMLPSALRTFAGFLDSIPHTVTERQVASSVQRWYGEYYLPAEIHVVPKGYDINGYALHHGGLDYHEDFWLKEGYIIVNFDIVTIKDGELNLSYINAVNSEKGCCNMWKREGYQYQKTSYPGINFKFQDGDYVIYYANHSVWEDYLSSGTH